MSSVARPVLPLTLLVLLALSAGCHAPAPGGVQVEVNSALQPGVDLDRVDVIARFPGLAGSPALRTESFQGPELRFPLRVNFVSGESTAAGTELEVVASATRQGEAVSTASGLTTLKGEKGATLQLTLEAMEGATLPPLRELCDNGLDDDGDGNADCADPDCDSRKCQSGGMTCQSGRCGCAGGVVGVAAEWPTFLPRQEPSALVLADGRLVTLGGKGADGALLSAVELFDPSSPLVTRSLGQVREGFSTVALADGGMAVVGGVDAQGNDVSSMELLQSSGDFATVPLSPALHVRGTGAVEAFGGLVLAGGELSVPPATVGPLSTWMALPLSVNPGTVSGSGELSGLHGRAAIRLGDEVLFVGGPAGAPTERTSLLSSSGVVREGPPLPLAVAEPAVVALTDGRVLVMGGSRGGTQVSARAFLVQVRAGVVDLREVGSMQVAKAKPRTARASNGWVYVDDASTFSPAPEWFDPVGERFVPGSAPERRGYAVAGPFSSGVALSGGGPNGNPDGKLIVLTPACP
jgi:hypothetical protein